MNSQERATRSKMVLGLNAAGCIAFIVLMLLYNASSAAIPLHQLKTDSTKRHKSKSKISYSHTSVNGHRWTSRNNFSSMDIQYRGDISVNDTDTDVTAISPGGYLKIKKTTFGNTRSIIIESNSQGKLIREYYEGRKKLDFEGEGQKWLADVLLEVVRHTGIAAKDRVARFYKKGGNDAVINEIKMIGSSSGKGRYFKELVGICSEKDMPYVARKIGQYISSNSVRSELYREYSEKFMSSPEARVAFFEGIGYMTSNTERSNILRHTLRYNKLDEKGMIALLKVTRRMTSNTERGAVLREVNEQFPKTDEGIDAYFDVVESMTSNTEKGNILRNLIRREESSTKMMKMVLEAVGREFTSNHEMGSVLRAAVPKMKDDPKLAELYILAVNRMTSSTEMGNALTELIDYKPIKSTDAQISILRCSRRISSSTEKGRVLRKSTSFLGKSNEVDDAFFDALSSISSNSEKGYVMRNVINRVKMTSDMSIRVLESTRHFTSSTEIGNLMVSLSRVMPKGDPKVKEAYQQAARRLTSNTEYRRVMESLNK